MISNKMNAWMSSILLMCALALFNTASAAEKVTYLHTDALGSPIAASDTNGKIIWREAYHPFGEPIIWDSQGTQKQLYTAQPYDDDLKLSYYGARWYDPAVGRFMGIDPAAVNPENIYSFNRYAYANNNPYRYVDPDGEAAVEVFTDLMPAAGRSYGNLAAYAYGYATGNRYLIDAADSAMRREQVDGLLAIAAIVEPPGMSALNKAKLVPKSANAFSKVAPATAKQLQKKFKHAEDFGVSGNYNTANAKKFNEAIQSHLNSSGVKEISGSYRGNPVTFHANPNTGLTVIQNPNGSFLSGWKLNPQQLQHVLKNGKL